MAHISFALLQAHASGTAVADIADRLGLPEHWVEERIEAARLLVLILPGR
jgi:DNA-binding Lrp family transcriptional regulator